VHTMASVYGEQIGQGLTDEIWLRGEEMARRFVENRHRILRQARQPGPYIYGVYDGRIARLWPR
jgi:hypothetical protein